MVPDLGGGSGHLQHLPLKLGLERILTSFSESSGSATGSSCVLSGGGP